MRATLALVACLLLTGCGTAVAQPRAGAPSVPAASEPTVPTATAGATPQWPPHGCDEHVAGTFDFAFPVPGFATPEEAAAHYLRDGDQLLRQDAQPAHYRRGWMVVTADNEIRAIVTMLHSDDGYVVDSAETCAGAFPGPDVSTS